MTEAPVLSSVVVVPEPERTELPTSPQLATKRRQSSASPDRNAKRPRRSVDDGNVSVRDSQIEKPTDQRGDRRKSGQAEERKRGRRLFGALLGTLSQSSSSTAQKRRTDIEKKQQAKLKLQAEEQEAGKRKKLEELMTVRRREQKKYDEQSYYKPWEMLPEDEARIKAQIEEAEATVDRELGDFERARDAERRPSDTNLTDGEPRAAAAPVAEDTLISSKAGDTVGSELPDVPNASASDTNSTALPPDNVVESVQMENRRESIDETGDVVFEAGEDTVIY
ncbi:hypothetical protein LTR16_003157 [Cryomyces antarcticus]|uniref:Pinin/SDK/MemA protein domain-containing protein n=1 Tax=Cryomyces antarcticus TaxID=329879 RepID=A0ABR0M6Z2_9PEZI|nr:hypothetical protein LTR39_002404 [Cryomyces antarcticus]KAK5016573.1 hypothetical protein LTR60_002340 [Cryomyces antarcticus]KAK5289086.1 hypothetical protein LTR16_003157 [Cryomyces antarcticus]